MQFTDEGFEFTSEDDDFCRIISISLAPGNEAFSDALAFDEALVISLQSQEQPELLLQHDSAIERFRAIEGLKDNVAQRLAHWDTLLKNSIIVHYCVDAKIVPHSLINS